MEVWRAVDQAPGRGSNISHLEFLMAILRVPSISPVKVNDPHMRCVCELPIAVQVHSFGFHSWGTGSWILELRRYYIWYEELSDEASEG